MAAVLRALPALALLLCGLARGQAPAYSAAGIVNATDFSPGPFAPNSVVSLFGSNLTFAADPVTPPSGSTHLPLQLGQVSVYVDNVAVPLLYVSATQVNFLIPAEEVPGPVPLRVVRQGLTGPTVTITLYAAAPCLFAGAGQYALAADWNAAGAVVTPDAPAKPGDTLVLYATGLGATYPAMTTGDAPQTAAPIVNPAALSVLLNGAAIDASLIKYAGVTPGWPGLYQVNFALPGNAPKDPEIRLSLAGQTSVTGLKLAVSPPSNQ